MKGRVQTTRRLSAADAAFLYLEREGIPLHIACVAIFEQALPFEEFVESIDSRLQLIPRYKQIVSPVPFNVGHPTWEDDPQFDIKRHIFRARLRAPGKELQLQDLAGRVLSEVMDRGKPLWDIHVVDGLANGRGALIVRMHHSLADGISGAELVNVMLATTPEESYAIPRPRRRAPRRRKPESSLANTIAEALQGTIQSLIAGESTLLTMVDDLVSGRMNGDLQALREVLPEFAASVETLPFNKPCGGAREFCWTEFSLNDAQAIRAAVGGTLNDVILTALTAAIARYVKLHGETVKDRFIRVVCPVNLREDHGETLGNQLSFLPVALPIGLQSPVETLKAVAARTKTMKGVGAARLVRLAAACIGAAPPPAQALFWGALPLLPVPLPLFNIICTNVPGSPVPLYAVGKRMVACYPHVPTGYNLGVGCAVLSYDGKLFYGLTADSHAAPDAHRLRDFIRASFEELCRSAGIRKVARRTAAPQGRKRRPRSFEAKEIIPTAAPAETPAAHAADAAVAGAAANA
jgi:diacylglycerol O-acyltransferase